MTNESKQQNLEELKACPFCGGKAHYCNPITPSTNHLVYCENACLTIGFVADRVWNTRAQTWLVVDRIELAFMIQEIINECHRRKKDADMSDLVDKYWKKFGTAQPKVEWPAECDDYTKTFAYRVGYDNARRDCIAAHARAQEGKNAI